MTIAADLKLDDRLNGWTQDTSTQLSLVLDNGIDFSATSGLGTVNGPDLIALADSDIDSLIQISLTSIFRQWRNY